MGALKKRVACIVVTGLLLGVVPAAANAQQHRAICTDGPMVASEAGPPGTIVVDWQDTLCLEHADRIARLRRIAASLPPEDQPEFREYVVGRQLLPPVFRRDVPLLRIVFPEHSFFDTDRTEIRAEAMRVLELMAETLRRDVPDAAVFVAGHTDSRGTEEHNQALSVARANSVATELARLGVGPMALWRVGFGEAVPIADNDTPDGQAVNRRVEFIIGARTEAVATWLARQRSELCAEHAAASPAFCGGGTSPRLRALRTRIHVFVATPLTRITGLAAAPRRAVVVPRPSIHGGAAMHAMGIQVGLPSRIALDLQSERINLGTLNGL